MQTEIDTVIKCMTAGELIAALQQFPPHVQVLIQPKSIKDYNNHGLFNPVICAFDFDGPDSNQFFTIETALDYPGAKRKLNEHSS